mmetsp:Transcript_9889/g.20126  ORF Transcript_9889/g.20126 Transcript_9889/m.20126 type:complete len:317 (-) Transcript_9889:726-1676(-)
MKGKVRMGGVNMRVNENLGEKWGIKSYPWVASFYGGEKTEDMRGLSGGDSVVRFAESKFKDHRPTGAKTRAASPPATAESSGKTHEAAVTDETAEAVELVYGGNDAEHTNATWRQILGRHTWFFLHAVGATYPEHPSEADKQGVRFLIAALGQLFPCKARDCCQHKRFDHTKPEASDARLLATMNADKLFISNSNPTTVLTPPPRSFWLTRRFHPLSRNQACRCHLQTTLASKSLGPLTADSRAELSQWLCKLHNIVNLQTGKSKFECDALKLDLMYLEDCTVRPESPPFHSQQPALLSAGATVFVFSPLVCLPDD